MPIYKIKWKRIKEKYLHRVYNRSYSDHRALRRKKLINHTIEYESVLKYKNNHWSIFYDLKSYDRLLL